MTEEKYFNQERLGRILPAALVSVGFCLMLCIVGPLEIFANNIAEFGIPLGSFFGWLVFFFFFFSALFFSLLFFLPRKAYVVLYIAFIFLFVIMFLQLNFFNFGMHSLEGDGQQSKTKPILMVVDVLIWLVVLAGLILFYIFIKNKGIFKTTCIVLCVALVAAQLVTVLTSSIGISNYKEENPSYVVSGNCLTTKNLTTISQNNNVFIFCVDRFQSSYAQDALEEHPEYFRELDGFTFFKDNISRYSHTYPALMYMVSGVDNFGKNRLDYFDQAYAENKTISTLNDNGYLVNLFSAVYYCYDPATQFPTYLQNVGHVSYNGLTDSWLVALIMIELQLYRTFPLPLKGLLQLSSKMISLNVQYKIDSPEGESMYSTDTKFVYDTVAGRQFDLVEENVFSLIHFDGCHDVDYDDNWNRVHGGSIMWSVHNSFEIINLYLKAMKDAGVYEDATIVILGDHSHANHDVNYKRTPITTMMVKPSGVSTGGLKVSNAPTSHVNMWATIFRSEGIPLPEGGFQQENSNGYNLSVFDIDENATLTREYIWNVYYGKWRQQIWSINGQGDVWGNWEKTQEFVWQKNLFD